MTLAEKRSILFVPEGTVLAHVSRCIEVAKRLDRRRFSVQFACSGPAADRVEQAGFHRIPVETRSKQELLDQLHKGGSAFTTEGIRQYVEAEIPLFDALRPDVIVHDFRPSASISAELLGIPVVCLTNAVWTPYYARPLGPPESHIFTRILGRRICRRLMPMAQKAVFRHYAAPFNKVRKANGLAPQSDVRECMSAANLTLLADHPLFAPTSHLPPNVRHVGPIFWEPKLPDPSWVARLDRSRPIVYLTLGSTGGDASLPNLVHALYELGCQVLCTTGTREIEGLPRGCFSAAYAPGRRLCQLADVVICHGGNGTIYQALSAGKPIIGIPMFHDQEFHMQQVCRLRLGLSLIPNRRPLRGLQKAVETVLTTPAYREAASAFSVTMSDWHGAGSAAQQIEEFVSGRADSQRTQTEHPVSGAPMRARWPAGKRSPVVTVRKET